MRGVEFLFFVKKEKLSLSLINRTLFLRKLKLATKKTMAVNYVLMATFLAKPDD